MYLISNMATPDRSSNPVPQTEETQEEILGSVTQETQSTDKTFSIQLRTSARVSKKLKLDSQNVGSPAATEKKETKPEDKLNEPPKSNAVPRRVHELWSTEDKNAFFEALSEYGKDFDAIQTHMNNKRKKRGINQNISKNRDQARHFYYRTWHKISKYLKFPQEVNKAVREQYGLINFGEFRKKIGFVSEKNSVKLNELIYSGNTQVRIKGKTIRIKTPVCRALRKLNQLQETTDVKLPTRIVIELRPRNNESWSHVQSLAMNPRVRTSLPLHQQFISLVLFLQKKWQLPDGETKDVSVSNKEKSVSDLRSTGEVFPLLRLAPKRGISIVAPSVRSGEFVTSSRLSLLAYEEKFGAGKEAVEENLKQLQSANKSSKSNRNQKKAAAEDEKSKQTAENDTQPQTSSSKDGPFADTDFVSTTVNQLLSLNSEIDPSIKYGTDDPEWNSPGKDEFELDTEITASENKEEIIKKAKAGWTIENADAIRIGDLYLMFGADCKLQLDYWWDKETENQKLDDDASSSKTMLQSEKRLPESLHKLISIAKLYLNKERGNCTCGHVCKPSNKFLNGRKRATKSSTMVNSNDQDRSTVTTNLEMPAPKSHISVVGVQPIISRTNSPYSGSRGVSSFKEQLNLQYYNRRRSGDKQRALPSLPKVTVQVIKPKEVVPEVPDDLNIDSVSMDGDTIQTTAIGTNSLSQSELISNQLPLFGSRITQTHESNDLCTNLLLQDDDTKSSCSTITRFLKQTLPEVLPRSVVPSSNGINTPIISSINNPLHGGRESPTWCMSEASNFSITSLLNQLDLPTKQLNMSTVQVDDEMRYSTDVDTQFQRLINESSVDYTEKFANLAAQIASETNQKK